MLDNVKKGIVIFIVRRYKFQRHKVNFFFIKKIINVIKKLQ